MNGVEDNLIKTQHEKTNIGSIQHDMDVIMSYRN